jgi:hypothetical protein
VTDLNHDTAGPVGSLLNPVERRIVINALFAEAGRIFRAEPGTARAYRDLATRLMSDREADGSAATTLEPRG